MKYEEALKQLEDIETQIKALSPSFDNNTMRVTIYLAKWIIDLEKRVKNLEDKDAAKVSR